MPRPLSLSVPTPPPALTDTHIRKHSGCPQCQWPSSRLCSSSRCCTASVPVGQGAPDPAPLTIRARKVMVSLPGPPATSLLQVLFLGLSTFAPVACVQVELHVPEGLSSLEAVEGEDVVLPAWYTFKGEKAAAKAKPWEVLTLMWFLEQKGKDKKQVLSHISGATSSEAGVSLVYSMPSRNVSLRLQGLQEKNSGSYFCSVTVQDRQGNNRSHSSKTLELDVRVPPAPPSCRLLGVPRVGTNVTLSCQSPRSKPVALYQWVRPPPSSQVFYAPVLDAVHGSLRLKNLSKPMSGVYTCRAYNSVGSAQCNVTLEVITGPGTAVVAGAVVGALVGLGLLAALVLLCQRQGKALEEPANDIKEDAVAPRTLPWPKGSDTISKNGTLSSVTSSPALRPPQGPRRPAAVTPTPSPGRVPTSALSRKGAVPVMVPAQNQAGSLV